MSLYNMFEPGLQTLADLEQRYPVGTDIGIMQPYFKKEGRVLVCAYRENIAFLQKGAELSSAESVKFKNHIR